MIRLLAVPFLAAASLGACVSVNETVLPPAPAAPATKQVLVPGNHLYSAAVRHGDTIYLAGVIGRSETGDVREATHAAMTAVKTNTEAAGAAMADLLKCTVYMTDIDQYTAMNEVYATYFERDPPARTAIAVTALPFGALVEITCVAAAR
ncbi:RidA family protein [Hyphomonas sp.]|uniref:RidA family protein n=1 Tax=Hyphomonas sp. TaxID=87 RepID=UPI00391D0ECC